MNEKNIIKEFEYIQRQIVKLDDKLEPKFEIKEDVQHSLIWGSVVVIIAIVVLFIVKIVS